MSVQIAKIWYFRRVGRSLVLRWLLFWFTAQIKLNLWKIISSWANICHYYTWFEPIYRDKFRVIPWIIATEWRDFLPKFTVFGAILLKRPYNKPDERTLNLSQLQSWLFNPFIESWCEHIDVALGQSEPTGFRFAMISWLFLPRR